MSALDRAPSSAVVAARGPRIRLSSSSLEAARIVGVGTGVSPRSYSQEELLQLLRIDDPRIQSVFRNSAIERRHLTLPPPRPDGSLESERQGELLAKHKRSCLVMGRDALLDCLAAANAGLADIAHLCCVTSTGFLVPGLSALLCKELGLPRTCSRLDVVGMGCNAGLNALGSVSAWATANRGKLAILLCVEACSAAYVFDGTMRTAVVNSLFGDGAAALAVLAGGGKSDGVEAAAAPAPTIVRFASHLIPEASAAMRYDWDEEHGKFSFYLDPDIPYVVGVNARHALTTLLDDTGLSTFDIAHWLIHSGGKKVIDSVRMNLGLTRHDVRHTTGVLRDCGNVSSGSFLFSYERLIREGVVSRGDYGVMMTMGPGSTIELALLHWEERNER